LIDSVLLEAQKSHDYCLSREITADDLDRRYDIFHASSTGHCIRKVIANYLNGKSAASLVDYDYTKCLFPEYERARILKAEDPEFQGLMHLGKKIHTQLQLEWDEQGLIVAGDSVSSKEIIESLLQTHLDLGQEADLLLDVYGTADCLLQKWTDLQDSNGEIILTEIKSVGETRWKMLKKGSVIENETDRHKMVFVLDSGIKECSQAMCYRLSLPAIIAFNPNIRANPAICYYNKSTAELMWAEVEENKWMPFVINYWTKVWEALDDWNNLEVLPIPVPIEKWECMWAKGKKKCEYYHLCFPGKDKKCEYYHLCFPGKDE